MEQPLAVVGPVPGHPALVAGRGQQALGLVRAQELDADAHLGRQLGRAVAGLADLGWPRRRSDHAISLPLPRVSAVMTAPLICVTAVEGFHGSM